MPEYGKCTKCGKEIDLQKGYSNRIDVKERFCIPCQFSDAAQLGADPIERMAKIRPTAGRKLTSVFDIVTGPVGRLGTSIGEFRRRSRVANEAHEGGKAIHRPTQ
jgi:hypothetical protein